MQKTTDDALKLTKPILDSNRQYRSFFNKNCARLIVFSRCVDSNNDVMLFKVLHRITSISYHYELLILTQCVDVDRQTPHAGTLTLCFF